MRSEPRDLDLVLDVGPDVDLDREFESRCRSRVQDED
jgi:hypothetical protein